MKQWINPKLSSNGKPFIKEFPDAMEYQLRNTGWQPYLAVAEAAPATKPVFDLPTPSGQPEVEATDSAPVDNAARLLSGETLSNKQLDELIAAHGLTVSTRAPLSAKEKAVKKALTLNKDK